MVFLQLILIAELISVYQTQYVLVDELIPQTVVQQINELHILLALTTSICSIFTLLLYYYKKYVLVILTSVISIALTLIVTLFKS